MPRKKHGGAALSSEAWLAKPERAVEEAVAGVRAQLDRYLTDAAGYARRSPEKALLCAFAGGYVLRMMPVTRVLGCVIPWALVLVKPAALIYGAVRLWETTQGAMSSRNDAGETSSK